MSRRNPLTSLALEKTIDTILGQIEKRVISDVEDTISDSHTRLDDAMTMLTVEYEKIMADGRKEADKVYRQIVGSADLEARNKYLITLEEAVDRVFTSALEEVSVADRTTGDYPTLLRSLIDESMRILGTSEVIISTNHKDMEMVKATLEENYTGSELLAEPIECIGGVRARSKDGTMAFDNTLDAKIDRLKPLIRKQIAFKFGVGN